MYETTDGEKFEDKDAAKNHQRKLDVRRLMEPHTYHGMSPDDIADLITGMREQLLAVLK